MSSLDVELQKGKLNLIFPNPDSSWIYYEKCSVMGLGGEEWPMEFKGDLQRIVEQSDGNVVWEHPEALLHPVYELELADWLIKLFLDNRKTRSVWGVQTHSEAIMLRVRKRVREGALKASDLNIISVASEFTKTIKLDDDGEFLNAWPEPYGFHRWRLNEYI